MLPSARTGDNVGNGGCCHCCCSPSVPQQPRPIPLRVVSAAPNGEVATLAEANEIRVVFSEPMVTLGRIPAACVAPFFRVTPAIPGTFRWSGHDDPDLHAGSEAAASRDAATT